jgi:hypothetical protein
MMIISWQIVYYICEFYIKATHGIHDLVDQNVRAWKMNRSYPIGLSFHPEVIRLQVKAYSFMTL